MLRRFERIRFDSGIARIFASRKRPWRKPASPEANPGDSMPRAADAVSSGYRNVDGVLDGVRTRQGEATWNDALNDRLITGQAVPVIRQTFVCIAGNDAPEPNPATGILAAHARRNSAKCHAAIEDAETQLEWPSSTRFVPCARAFSQGRRFPGTSGCGYAM